MNVSRLKYIGLTFTLPIMVTLLLAAPAFAALAGISNTSPEINAVSAPVDTNISVTFDAAIDPTTANSGTFVVHSFQSGLITGTYSLSNGNTTVTLNPANNIFPGDTLFTSLTTGITNGSNQPIAPAVWQFTTASGIGAGTFPPGVYYGTGSDRTSSVALGDVDGDGDLDLVAGNWVGQNVVYLNDGDGDFSVGNDFGTGNDGTQSVALGDMDGDGDLDLVVGNGANTFNRQNVVYLNDGDGDFSSGNNFGTGVDDTRSVALGDIDGDGDLDIVVGNSYSGNQYGPLNPQDVVYMNDGDGTFDTITTTVGTDEQLTAGIALGDMDNDGDLDIVAGYNGDQNKVYLNDGDGTFDTTSHNFGTGTDKTRTIALGDVDNDGDLDIAVANYPGRNLVYYNNGDGTFDATGHYFGVEDSNANHVALSDMDGDGYLDIIEGNYNEQDFVYPNNGDGTFAAIGNHFGDGSSNTNANRESAIGDLDGDGDLDIAVANIYEQNVVYFNGPLVPDLSIDKTVSSSSARPGEQITYTISFANADPGVTGLATGVIITDRVPMSVTNPTVVSNSGANITLTGAAPIFVWDVQDLTPGDGGIITLTGVLSEPLASGVFTNTVTISTIEKDSNLTNNSAAAVVTVVQNIGPTAVDDPNEATDLNSAAVINPLANDSDPENDILIITVVGNPTHGSVTISGTTQLVYTPTLNFVGTDVFTYTISDSRLTDTAVITVAVSPPRLIAFSPIGNRADVPLSSRMVLTYSVNLDVDKVNSQTIAIHSMKQGLVTETYSAVGAVVTIDPTRDFFPGELVYATATKHIAALNGMNPPSATVWQFNAAAGAGPATFNVASNAVGAGDGTYAVAFGDVDGDGDLDLAVGNYGPNLVYLNDGDGTFDTTSHTFGTGSDGTYAVAFGDVDGDGDLDLAVGNYYGQNVVYLNDGDGTFDTTSINFGPANDATYALALGDVDADGDLDIAVGNNSTQNTLYLNDGDGSFTNSVNFGPANDVTFALAFGDVDGDSDLDIAAGNYNEQNTLYLNDGDGAFANSVNFGPTNDATYDVNFGDVDGDGDLDIAVGNLGQSAVYLNNGDGTFDTTSADVGVRNDTLGIALGDADGDGDLDIAMGIYGYNAVQLNQSFPDVSIVKTVTPTIARPGTAITYTLTYSNTGWETATGVVITDSMPISVTNPTVVTSSGAVITQTGTAPNFVWDVADLSRNQGGIITLTGVLSSPLASGIFTNTAEIATTSVDTDLTNNIGMASLTVVQNAPPVAIDDPHEATRQDIAVIISPLINDTDLNGDSLTISGVGNPVYGMAVISGSTQIVYTPTLSFYGTDVFTYTASDGSLTDMAMITVTVAETEFFVYMPQLSKNHSFQPDLVITDLIVDGNRIEVTIRNIGNAPTTDDFWLDVYFNPTAVPIQNDLWYDIAPAGAAWGVTKILAPDEALTLTIDDAYYYPELSSDSFPAGAVVYGYIDSYNPHTDFGTVQESNEANNRWPSATPSLLP